LQVVLAAVLGHRGALDERLDRIAVILTEALPSVLRGTELQQLARPGDVREATMRIELDPIDRIQVRGAEVHEPAIGVRVVEDVRVPRSLGSRELRHERREELPGAQGPWDPD